MIKIGAAIFVFSLLLVIVFSLFFSSATEKNLYFVGEQIKLDLSNYEGCSLKLKTPSTTIVENICPDKFLLDFKEQGGYILDIKSNDLLERKEFQVEPQNVDEIKQEQESIGLITESNLEIQTGESGEITENQSSLIKIGEPVKNLKKLNFEEEQTVVISLPQNAENISLEKDSGESVLFKEKKTLIDSIQNTLNKEDEKSVIIKDASGDINLEYFTPGPEKNEFSISELEKKVIVSSEEGLHYEQVLAYTSVPERITLDKRNSIKVYWNEEDIYLDYTAKDTNNNGLIDYIEWVIPHLSEQSFNIILVTKAEHLTENRTFISDIYDSVKELDNNWSEVINEGEFVRVYFERNLTSINDITLFTKIVSGNPQIEVYEFNESSKVAEFSSLNSEEYNTIFLENLIGAQNAFDLKIINGKLQFDHIIDPQTIYNVNSSRRAVRGQPTSSSRWIAGTNSTASQYANMATENGVYASVGPTSNNDFPFYRFNFTINENLNFVSSIFVRFTGYDNAGEDGTVYIWRFENSTWMPIGITGASNANITRNLTSDITNYVDSNKQFVVLVEGDSFDTNPSVDYLYVDYVGVTVQYTSDSTPPIYNRVSVNNTIPDKPVRFAINASDNFALNNTGGYIFSTNNSGAWENDTFVTFSSTPSWANVTKLLTSVANTVVGYRWYFNDTSGNTNSTPIYTLTTSAYPPSGAQIQCEESGSWKDCSGLSFSEILTRVRINCSGTVINASFNLTNIPDSSTLISSNATSNETSWWIYNNPDLTINDSGTFNLTGICYGPASQLSNFVNWSIPWGNLTVSLISPNSNGYVNEKEFFNFTASVSCTGGECGNVNATLDPEGSWWNTDYENRKLINITNPGSSLIVEGYSMNFILDTTGINFQDDGDDLRVVWWNGTNNVEIDRFNDSLFNIATTSIWFRVQSNISAGSFDDHYYLYYNNSDAVNPPNNGSNVFEFFDNFNRADSGTVGNGWTESTGVWEILNGWVRNTNNGDSDLSQLSKTTTNHSIRAIANQVVTDADLKLSIRSSLSPTGGYTFGYQNGYLEFTTGNHNTANLGSSAISTMAGVPYELEINAMGNRITTYKDGTLIFNVTSAAASSGFFLLHSWDVSEFDDVWIRKLVEVEPTYTFGNAEKRSKGIISTIIGATPFYTTSRNPMDSVGNGCLSNMKPGTICNVTWQVNATGKIGSIWTFFVYANNTNYLNYFNTSYTSAKINITIGNIPPEIPELNYPENNTALSSMIEFNWSNSIDQTGDTVYYGMQISNSTNFSYLFYSNYSIRESGGGITGVTPTGISQEGKYYWRVFATDLKSNSSWSEVRAFYYDLYAPTINLVYPSNLTYINSSNTINFVFNVSDSSLIQSCNLIVNDSIKDSSYNITKGANQTFVLFLNNSWYTWKINCTDAAGRVGDSGINFFNVSVSNNPPVAREIECEKNGAWYNCSSIVFGDVLTRIRVRCTDPEEGVTNASINLTNLPDDYTYFSNITTDSSYDPYWIFDNNDITVNDSGAFKAMATCYDSESLSGTNSSSWDIPSGSLLITLLNPNANTSVMKNAFFTFSSRISCIGGECGNINVTLDPINWWNDSWYYRKTINVTNAGSTTLSNFPIYLNLSKENAMQSDFDDIRFINGSCGSTPSYLQLNYEIENYSSSKSDVWINIPSFAPGKNQICMYYGNSFASSGQNSAAVWNSDYMMVQHLNEQGIGSRNDSTSNRRNMSTTGYDGDEKVLGEVDGADNLDGVNDALNSTSNFLSNRAAFTIEGWIRPKTWGSRVSLVGQNDVVEFFLDGSNTVMIWTSGGGSVTTAYPYSLDTWHYITAVGTGTNLIIYFDGVQSTSGGTATANYGTSAYYVKIGEGVVDAAGGYFNGTFDEVRISNSSRSADWINQTYQIIENQNNLISFGSSEEKSKGIISTTIGATPFYTTTPNPLNSTTKSCLANMKSSGGTCEVNWSVNATGEINSVWEFFVIANNLNYKEYFNISAESSRINITIATQVPPSVPQLYRPLNATSFSSIPNLNWTNSTDPNGDAVYYGIQVSNVSDFSTTVFSNYSIRERANPTNITPTGITSEGAYYWRVFATDLISNSSWSETRIFYYDLSAPNISFINQTGEDNRIINSTNWLNRGENLSIFVNISDINIDKVWMVVWNGVVGGVEKVKVFFTYVGGFLWVAKLSTDQVWGGIYNYTIYSNDTLGSQINYSTNFTVLGGNISLSINPSYIEAVTNISVSGHLNFSNSTNLTNYPINLWLDGKILFLQNLTGIGTYDYTREVLETSNNEFSQGTFYDTEVQGNENITLSTGRTSGNFTKILDAGALVSWNNISWSFEGAPCSGTFSYQEGDANSYSSTADTYISSSTPTSNYGSLTGILVDGSPSSDRSLIKFDNLIGKGFNQVPENSTITNANLTIYISDTGDAVNVYQILENWTENEATYNNRLTGTSWTSSGCSASPSRATNPDASFTASTTGAYTLNITNSLKSWVVNSQNFGWVFDMPTSNGINIRTSEYSTQTERPLLMVDYSAAECTNIVIYIRTSNNKTIWSPWKQVSNGGIINDSNSYSRYLEYRVEFSSVNSTLKPVLKDVLINYTAVVTDVNGNFNYNFTSPSTFGNHPIVANTSYKTIIFENSTSLTVQTGMAPNVSLVTPNQNQWFNYGNITITYNTTDVNNDFAFSELIINGLVNVTNSTPIVNYAYNNFTINFSSGQYNWTVNITDNGGYKATATPRTFYIDLINPNVSLVYPDNGGTYSVNQINLSFNATDNMDSNLSCSVVFDGNILRTGVGAQNGNITNVTTGIISGGIHYWNVSCTDNAFRNFTSPTFNFNISDTPPNVTLISPVPNYLDNDGILSFIYNASDNTGFLNCSLILNSSYRYWNSSAILNYQTNSFDIENFSEGYYNWTVECFDLSRSPSKPVERNFSVDLFNPNISLIAPQNYANVSVSDISFNFSVNDSFDSSLNCNLTVNGQIMDSFNANSGNLTSRTLTGLTDGLKYWNVTCKDDALHSNTSQTWIVNITEYPKIFLNTSNNSRFNQTSINLTYTPSDNSNISACSLLINGVFNQTNSTPVLNKQGNNFTINSIPEGKYNWSVNCTDAFGLKNQSAETRIFYADRSPPVINISYPKGNGIFDKNITFNFTVTDVLDSNLSCNITVNSSVVDANFSVQNGTLTNRTVSGITDGYHVWNLTCWDNAGNTNTSATYSFIRYTNPTVTLTSPANNSWFNSSSLNLFYFPEDDEAIVSSSLYINGVFNRTNSSYILNRDYNNFSLSGFADGAYFWNVNVTDPTGLTGIGNELRFYIDTHSPSVRLNFPNQSYISSSNNVTFNFSISDNLDNILGCNFTLDGELDSSGNYSITSDIIKYGILADGNHSWSISCVDDANNINVSQTINFTVEAPPNVTLNSPIPDFRTTNSSIIFFYTPTDPINLPNCSFYLDGAYNTTKTDILFFTNQTGRSNNFTIAGINEGMHNWTVNCTDSDVNYYAPEPWTFYRDISPPSIILNSPDNNSGINYNNTRVYFNLTAIDILDNAIQCNLTIDGVVRDPNFWVSNNSPIRRNVLSSVIGQGTHTWNVTCWDQVKNINTSEVRMFNLTYPDLAVYSSSIILNETEIKENQSITINATIFNLGGADAENVIVRFYNGDPDSGGIQIGSNILINVSLFNQTNVSTSWSAQIGTSQIFIIVDPPTLTNGSFIELNETNNKASKSISVGSWHFFYGDVLTFSDSVLANAGDKKLTQWEGDGFQLGNIYVTDYDSYVSWTQLQAIGKTKSGTNSSSDFSEVDTLLNSSTYDDSVYSVYTDSGIIKKKINVYSFNKLIQEIPVTNSTNNSNFVTGILWDSSDDTNGSNGEFDLANKEDLIFITPINKSSIGTYGIYDYEIRVPAKLRQYKLGDSKSVSFYVELI